MWVSELKLCITQRLGNRNQVGQYSGKLLNTEFGFYLYNQ